MHKNRVAIVGIGETLHSSRRPYVNDGELIYDAVTKALSDAELTIRDIDSVAIGNMDFFEGHAMNDAMLSLYSGAAGKPGFKMNTGGTVGTMTVIEGWYQVASGMADTCLCVGWEKHDEATVTPCISTITDPAIDRPFCVGALSGLAVIAIDYMTRTGCTVEHAAMVRANASLNAARNPNAHLRDKYTVEDIMNARMVLYPLNLLTVCPTSLGAGAVILCNESKARKISKKPVWIKDHVSVHSEYGGAQFGVNEKRRTSHIVAGEQIFKRNGITNPRKETQVFEMYDPSAYCIPAWMEDFGICEIGEGWKLVEKGSIALEAEYPINPSGGTLCTNAIGDTALLRVAEAALQIRGDAGEHQVTREVKQALASGFGGSYWTDLFLLSKTTD
ncbi:MAG: thiolase family protein [Dehalococcoidia bacterium]|nr:thiolase family protein [Dehalococcoidia bacterium]